MIHSNLLHLPFARLIAYGKVVSSFTGCSSQPAIRSARILAPRQMVSCELDYTCPPYVSTTADQMLPYQTNRQNLIELGVRAQVIALGHARS